MDDETWHKETMRRFNHKNMKKEYFKPKEWKAILDFIETAKTIDKEM